MGGYTPRGLKCDGFRLCENASFRPVQGLIRLDRQLGDIGEMGGVSCDEAVSVGHGGRGDQDIHVARRPAQAA